MGLATLLAGAATLLSLCALALAWRCARVVGASEANVLREAVEAASSLARSVRADLETVQTRLDGQDAKLLQWRADVEGLMEVVEDNLERTETKRRRAAAAESRARARNGENNGAPPDDSYEGLRQRARAMGHEVL